MEGKAKMECRAEIGACAAADQCRSCVYAEGLESSLYIYCDLWHVTGEIDGWCSEWEGKESDEDVFNWWINGTI